MKVFLSWSGDRSKAVATALHGWLRRVVQRVNPWMSAVDIAAGARWSTTIARELDASTFGVVCLTPENLHSQWLNFEAGALAKKMDESRVVPYLFGLSDLDVTGPLSQFQMKAATRNETAELVAAINSATDEPLSTSELEDLLEAFWPQLERSLIAIPSTGSEPTTKRSPEEKIDEILDLVRGLQAAGGVPGMPAFVQAGRYAPGTFVIGGDLRSGTTGIEIGPMIDRGHVRFTESGALLVDESPYRLFVPGSSVEPRPASDTAVPTIAATERIENRPASEDK